MADRCNSRYPMFKELILIQKDLDPSPNPGFHNFGRCRGEYIPDDKNDKTQRTLCTEPTTQKDRAEANQLKQEFKQMDECNTSESHYIKMEKFLTITHCSSHRPHILARFEEWKTHRTLTATGTPESPPTKEQPALRHSLESNSGSPNDISTNYSTAHARDAESTELPLTPESSPVPDTANSLGVDISTPEKPVVRPRSPREKIHGHVTFDSMHKLGVGLVHLRRTGSLRDKSPVFREMYKPLTAKGMEQGRVYILRHKVHDDIFKIGWTRGTADFRLKQPNNCYKFGTEVLYQTKEPFVGAYKAETLVNVIFQHQNLIVDRCDQCGDGHKEWYKVSKEEAMGTVELMERFVRLPAYESALGGKMKLSPAADAIVKHLCDFSPEKLDDLVAQASQAAELDTSPAGKAEVTAAEDAAILTTTQLPSPPASDILTDSKEDSANVPLPSVEGKPKLPKPLSIRHRVVRRISDNLPLSTRSKPGLTPERATGDSAKAKAALNFKERLVVGLWNALPKDKKASGEEEIITLPKYLASLGKRISDLATGIWGDFQTEIKDKREERRARSASTSNPLYTEESNREASTESVAAEIPRQMEVKAGSGMPKRKPVPAAS